jgi:hypothetical protein
LSILSLEIPDGHARAAMTYAADALEHEEIV